MTSMNESLRLAELLCARLCHDLSGPLGALIGILEIARDEQPDSETLALAEDTAVELGQRLKLLRAAWGQDGDELDVARLRGFADCLSSEPAGAAGPGGTGARRGVPGAGGARGAEPGAAGRREPAGRRDRRAVRLGRPAACWSRFPARAPPGRPVSPPRCIDEAAAWEAMLADPRRLQGPLTALLARGLGLRLSMLMPAGAMGEAEVSPPLLLSLQRGIAGRDLPIVRHPVTTMRLRLAPCRAREGLPWTI